MQQREVGRGCDLRHSELRVPGVRRTDGRTRQGVPLPGRMLDGLASGMGAGFRRTPPEIEEVGQANLGAHAKMAGVMRSPDPDARVGAQSRLADRTARELAT